MLSACSNTSVTPVPAAAPAARSAAPRASATPAPLAYVSEVCNVAASCTAPNGMVEILGSGAAPITDGVDEPGPLAMDKRGNLYVGGYTSPTSGFVSVYPPNGTTPARTISNIQGEPKGLGINGAGRLFMVEQTRQGCCQMVGSGWVYKAGASTPLRQLRGVSGFPHAPIFDKWGNAYIANFDVFPGWIDVYARGSNLPSRTIQNGIGFPIGNGIALTPKGDLVVLNLMIDHTCNVEVFPKGASSPTLTITHRLPSPTAVAVDQQGNIYVANDGTTPSTDNVVVYASGKTTVRRTIRTGINYPVALAFDKSGRLYVANSPDQGANTVTVYAPGGSKPIATYTLKQQFAELFVPN